MSITKSDILRWARDEFQSVLDDIDNPKEYEVSDRLDESISAQLIYNYDAAEWSAALNWPTPDDMGMFDDLVRAMIWGVRDYLWDEVWYDMLQDANLPED